MPTTPVNHSPRLDQIDHKKTFPSVSNNFKTDVVIIGWWIAGIATAFYILKNTQHSVTIVEWNKIAHWATGHNWGHACMGIEKPFTKIVEKYWVELALQWYKDTVSGFQKLQEIVDNINKIDLVTVCPEYTGYSTIKQIMDKLQTDYIKELHKDLYECILINEAYKDDPRIDAKYYDIISFVPADTINKIMESKEGQYIGIVWNKAGVMNSALFCQEVIEYLLSLYHDRLQIYEHTKVKSIHEKPNVIEIAIHNEDQQTYTIKSKQTILCTNGYKNIDIYTDTEQKYSLWEKVQWFVSYISGYVEKSNQESISLIYYQNPDELKTATTSSESENYFYLTRREFETHKVKETLICIGWPESAIEWSDDYIPHQPQPERAHQQMDSFLQKTFKKYPKQKLEYKYRRHGLMGYTNTYLRMIWPDRNIPRIMYNLGCNGQGIVLSIFGWWKISQFLLGRVSEDSIFDPE
jgi:glycine/D-amino acid oxidase-like deaminating enzyme